MLAVDPAYALTGSEISPSALRVFSDVRARLLSPLLGAHVRSRALALALTVGRRDRAEAVAEAVAERLEAEAAQPDLTLRFVPRLGTRYISFTGQDRAVYAAAPGLDLGMDILVGDTGWGYGFTISYSQHAVLLTDLLIEDNDTLETLHINGRAGYELRWGWLGLRPVVGLGPTAFGIADIFDTIGLSAFGGLDVMARLGPRLVDSQ